MALMYAFLLHLKLFYLDNCLYIAVEMFSSKFVLSEKNYHCSFDINFEKVQFYLFSHLFFLKGW